MAIKTLHLNTERTWRGGELQAFHLIQGLLRRNHEAHLIAQAGGEMAERARKEGIRTFEVKMRGEWDPLAIFQIRNILRKGGYPIVHMHTSHGHTLGCIASILGGGGIRVVSRRVDFSIYRHPLSISRWKYARLPHHIIAISQGVKRALQEDGIPEGMISVVPSGIDPHTLNRADPASLMEEFRLDPESPRVGCVAHFGWHKGQEVLVRAASLVRREVPKARFFFVGKGEYKEKCEALAAKLNLERSVIFTGFREDVPNFLALFNLFVMPSLMEGLCTSILDALALERPVVASAVGGIPEIIDHGVTGLLVPPGDPIPLAEAIVRLLKNPQEGESLAKKGREKVLSKFTHNAMVEGTLQVYRSLLEDPEERDSTFASSSPSSFSRKRRKKTRLAEK